MHPILTDMFKAIKRGRKKDEQLFVGMNYRRFYRALKKACREHGIEDVTPHTLRHTFGSRLGMTQGVGQATIQHLMGHKTARMTERYIHLTDEHKRNAVANINQGCHDSVTVLSKAVDKKVASA